VSRTVWYLAGSFCVLSLGLGGCSTPRVGPLPASDRYEICQPEMVGWDFAEAQREIDAGNHAEGLALLRKVLLACPEFMPAHLAYQRAAREQVGAAHQEMIEFYTDANQLPGSPVAPFMKALLATEDFDRLQLLEESVNRDRSFYYGHLELGRLRRSLSKPQLAMPHLRDALQARESFAEAKKELAGVLEELGQYEEAEALLAAYLRARPDDDDALRTRVRLLIYDLGRPRDAKAGVESLKKRYDDLDLLMHDAAIVWRLSEGRDDLKKAADEYRRVLQVDAHNDIAVLNLANLYYGPLAQGSDQSKREYWPKARNAYRYYCDVAQIEGFADFFDRYGVVVSRLRVIDGFLGQEKGPPRKITLADF
jgi:tetratricopeptide (TPR) repeat protein